MLIYYLGEFIYLDIQLKTIKGQILLNHFHIKFTRLEKCWEYYFLI